MINIRISISIYRELLSQAEETAEELGITVDSFFIQAAEEFITHHRNQQLLKKINEANTDLPNERKTNEW